MEEKKVLLRTEGICKQFNGIKVLYQPRENMDFQSMGVCVSMSGTGCRTFENHTKMLLDDAHDEQGTGYTAFPNLFQIICANNCNVSRIDIACDDHDGALNMDDIVESVMNNDVCTRMQKRQVVLSYDGVDKDGTTVYFGAPSSDFRVRIYDKAKEQGDLVSHWVRVELVFKGKNALAFVQNLELWPVALSMTNSALLIGMTRTFPGAPPAAGGWNSWRISYCCGDLQQGSGRPSH